MYIGQLMRVALFCALLVACGDDNGTNDDGGDDPSTLTATIDGLAFTANAAVTAVQGAETLTITGTNSNNRGIVISLPIASQQATKTGTYDAGPGFAGVVTYNIGMSLYQTSAAGGTGTVTVTSYSATRVAGTFSVTAVGTAGTVGNRVITNGAFDVKF